MQRTIATTAGLLLLLAIFTTITACSSQNSTVNTTNSKTETSTGNTSTGSTSTESTETHDFTLSGNTPPTLITTNDVGSVNVQSGSSSNTMHAKVTKSGGNPSDIQVNYNQSGNTVTITIKRINTDSNARAEADITLPSKSDLQLQNGTGDITVTGTEGKMSLTNGTGSINVTQVKLTSNSQLQTSTGSVNFSGSIGGGNYQFQSNTGSIEVKLPSNASFHIDAKTNVGSISSDFPNVTVQQENIVGASASGTVGSASSARITLTTDTGSIDLTQL